MRCSSGMVQNMPKNGASGSWPTTTSPVTGLPCPDHRLQLGWAAHRSNHEKVRWQADVCPKTGIAGPNAEHVTRAASTAVLTCIPLDNPTLHRHTCWEHFRKCSRKRFRNRFFAAMAGTRSRLLGTIPAPNWWGGWRCPLRCGPQGGGSRCTSFLREEKLDAP